MTDNTLNLPMPEEVEATDAGGTEYVAEVDDLDAAEPDEAEDGLTTEWHYGEQPAQPGAPQNARPEDSPIYDQMVAEAQSRGEAVL